MLKADWRKATAPEPRRCMGESLVLKSSSARSKSFEKIRSKPAVADLMWETVSSVGESIAIGDEEESKEWGIG